MRRLSNFIKENALQKLGCGFNDILVERNKLIQFIEMVYQCGYFVTDISWWKHRMINYTSDDNESMGGIVDCRNKKYYWAETIYYQAFDVKYNAQPIVISYYNDCCNNSTYDNLIPSISIDKIQ